MNGCLKMSLNKSKGKVLFFYPNKEGYGGIPNGIALLSGCLKKAGYQTKCFDTTFMNLPPETLFNREKHGGVMKIDEMIDPADTRKILAQFLDRRVAHQVDVGAWIGAGRHASVDVLDFSRSQLGHRFSRPYRHPVAAFPACRPLAQSHPP